MKREERRRAMETSGIWRRRMSSEDKERRMEEWKKNGDERTRGWKWRQTDGRKEE